jgi:uncharacterized membrane protein YdjX (TVP38/TMEM64 family)
MTGPYLAPARPRLLPRLLVAATVATAVFLALRFTGALDQLSFAGLAHHRQALAAWVEALGHAAPFVFVLLYAICTALSLPTGLLLSTLGGFLFGTVLGGALNVLGATLGATAVFLAARTVLGDALRERAGPSLRKLEAGFREDAFSYLLVLRLVPLFPFWLVNLAPAFLGVRLGVFIAATAIGIVPGALVFSSVGTGLDAILDAGGTPDASTLLQGRVLLPIAGLALLALVPVAYKRLRRGATDPRILP